MDEREKLQQMQNAFIQSLPENFSILEEAIDVDIQHKYFEFGKDIEKLNEKETVTAIELTLKDDNFEAHRLNLIRLARTERAEAYRVIVNYREQCTNKKMKAWATLAMQESRMVLESDLLDDDHPVFVSTGLGGKNQSIRFFMVVLLKDAEDVYTQVQKRLVRTELDFQLKGNGGELEHIRFVECFAICTFLYPLKKQLQPLITDVMNECNQYGNFLREELIITNVKKLSLPEIRTFVKIKESENQPETPNHLKDENS
ncbi:MAG: hypothetical protein ACK5MI_09410 [Mangrovibacterium sp.]